MHTTDKNEPLLKEVKSNGQNAAYLILSAEDREKGFVRPVRTTYVHTGTEPTYPTRELTAEEHERYDKFGYVAFEAYPDANGSPVTGRFWTAEQLKAGCQTRTTITQEIAETYARDPNFYGSTFCVNCGKHLPVGEFKWLVDGSVVGS